MNKKFAIFLWLPLFLLFGACSKHVKPSDASAPEATPALQLYYTQFSLFQEENNFRTTNYRRGILIPINTPATLVSMDDDYAYVKLADTGQSLRIENVPKYTKDDMRTAFKKILGPSKVDLQGFSKLERESILIGKVRKDMSKKAVLAAIGYPPQHETPSLDGNDWTYWSARFNKFIVHFTNGKVDNIVD